MLCRSPYMMGTLECPCGGCLSCRINRRRVWAHRILLESYKHGDNSFVTLTYDDDHVPSELVKADYQNFLKKLRKSIYPRKIRYFIAGEYGELSGRPHFHAAVFGLDRFTAGGELGQTGVVQSSWGKGFTFVGDLTWNSAQYIAGYLTKKVQGEKHESSVREFSRMSLRPGIGSGATSDIARSLLCGSSINQLSVSCDVPTTLRHGKRLLPLGRYLRRQIRGELGFISKDTPPEASRLYALQQAAQKAEERATFKQKDIIDRRYQVCLNQESRFLVRDSKRSLK